jgi:hypothetical protein
MVFLQGTDGNDVLGGTRRDALAPGVSPLAESREQGGAIYAVG